MGLLKVYVYFEFPDNLPKLLDTRHIRLKWLAFPRALELSKRDNLKFMGTLYSTIRFIDAE